jgi:hypothetical protein
MSADTTSRGWSYISSSKPACKAQEQGDLAHGGPDAIAVLQLQLFQKV